MFQRCHPGLDLLAFRSATRAVLQVPLDSPRFRLLELAVDMSRKLP
jgi:hypothetical protein